MKKHFKDAPDFFAWDVPITPDVEQHTLTEETNTFSSISPFDSDSTIAHKTIPIADTEMYKIPVNL